MVGLLVSFLSFDSVHGLFQRESRRTIKEARLVLAQGFRGACPCQADGIGWGSGVGQSIMVASRKYLIPGKGMRQRDGEEKQQQG